ncbi:MAG TPA: SHOCT domain-containing protein [Oscillospiraceae bacterium]|nr:SHOCT domain-containing protein [Oscillospiraceae bacterium]
MGKNIKVKPGKGQSTIGFFAGLVFCGIGFFIVIPTAGLFGIFWTIMAVIITVVNGINAFTNKAIVSHEIMISDAPELQVTNNEERLEPEQRLQELQNLYDKGLISATEFQQKRKNIIDSI